MDISPEDFVLGYLAATPDLFESPSVWETIGELQSFIELEQHMKLISSVLSSRVSYSSAEEIIKTLKAQGRITSEYQSSKKYYYGHQLVLSNSSKGVGERAKPTVIKMINSWLENLFADVGFVAAYYLAVKEVFPDNLLESLFPEEKDRLISSGLVGKILSDRYTPVRQRKLLVFKQGAKARQIVDLALASETTFMTEVNKIKERYLSQLPENQRRLLSIISRFGYLTTEKTMDTKYYPVSSKSRDLWDYYYSDIEITKPAILAIARWNTKLSQTEVEEAFDKLVQKQYLISVEKSVYSGVYRVDLIPIVRALVTESSEKIDVKPYLEHWKKDDITQILFLDEVLCRQKSDRLSVKKSELENFETLTASRPPREVPLLFLQTDDEFTLNPAIREELRIEIEKLKQAEAAQFYSKLAEVKSKYRGNPLYSTQEDPQKQRLRIFTPKATFLLMAEAWLNSKQIEEIKILSSQVDESFVFILSQQRPWVSELLKSAGQAIPNLSVAFVEGGKIFLVGSRAERVFKETVDDLLTAYEVIVEPSSEVPPKSEVQIPPRPEITAVPPDTREQTAISTAPSTTSGENVSLENKMLLGQLVSIQQLRDFVKDRDLSRDQKRERLQGMADFSLPLEVMATHTAIFGANQGGKTTTTKRLIEELTRLNVPVLIIDWHSEYAEFITKLGREVILVPPTAKVKPVGNERALTWNILDPRFYSSEINQEVIEDYIGLVVNLLSAKQLLDLTEPMKNALTNALRSAYSRSKISNNKFPTFADISNSLESVPVPTTTLDALRRRLDNFTTGTMGSIFCEQTSFDPSIFFQSNVCIKMNHLTEEFDYAVGLLTFFILKQAASYFKSLGEAPKERPVRHVIVIDEGPAVLRGNKEVQNRLARMLEELRKFGDGLIIVARNTDIPKIVMRETNQKIVHRLQYPQDIDMAAKMIGLTSEKGIISDLPPGVCFFKSATDEAQLVRIVR